MSTTIGCSRLVTRWKSRSTGKRCVMRRQIIWSRWPCANCPVPIGSQRWLRPFRRPQAPQPAAGIDGQIVADSHTLPLDPTLAPGSYSIHVALIDAVTKAPQNIVAEDGHYIDDRLLLSDIRVQP
jgi:hypothetical protein